MARWVGILAMVTTLALLGLPAVGAQQAQSALYTEYATYGSAALFEKAPAIQIVKWDAQARLQATLPPGEIANLTKLLESLNRFETLFGRVQNDAPSALNLVLAELIDFRDDIKAPAEEPNNYALVRIGTLSLFLLVKERAADAARVPGLASSLELTYLDLGARAAHEAADSVEELKLRSAHDALSTAHTRDMATARADVADGQRVAAARPRGPLESIQQFEAQTLSLDRLERAYALFEAHHENPERDQAMSLYNEVTAERAAVRSALLLDFAVFAAAVLVLSFFLVARTLRWLRDRQMARLGEELLEVAAP